MSLERICVWFKTSTHSDTKELVNPVYCGDCDGYKIKCDYYVPKEAKPNEL